MVRQVFHEIPLRNLLNGPHGGVAKDLLRRGYKVQNRAKMLLNGQGARNPKRIRTGILRSSIQVKLIVRGKLAVRIGTNIRYAKWVHDGTGIYGPMKRRITPKHASVLRWKLKTGGYAFAKSTKGMRRNRFLKDALPAAAD